MLAAQHRGATDEKGFLLVGNLLLIHVDEILPPGIFMELEEIRVIEEAEAVGHLPLDLKIRGIEGLGLQWCC